MYESTIHGSRMDLPFVVLEWIYHSWFLNGSTIHGSTMYVLVFHWVTVAKLQTLMGTLANNMQLFATELHDYNFNTIKEDEQSPSLTN